MPDWVQVVMHTRSSSPPSTGRGMTDEIPLSSDSCSGTWYLQAVSSTEWSKGNRHE